MTSVRRLSILIGFLAPVLALWACGGGGLDTDYPSAGEDRFELTTATVEIEITEPAVGAVPFAGRLERVDLEGPARVTRSDPQDEDGDGRAEVATEIVEMELRGTSSLVGEVIVRESADRSSMGMVEQREPGLDFPAESFFDIFVEVEVPSISETVHNEEPLRMTSIISDLPPGVGDTYEDEEGEPKPLFTPAGVQVGRILDALHIPNPPPEDGEGPEPTATPTEEPPDEPTPTPTPTEEPGVSGTRDCDITVRQDPAGHAPFIGMPSMLELDFSQTDSMINVAGPPPWVGVSGSLVDHDSITATGIGEVAGFPDIAVKFQGLLQDGGVNGNYIMGADGGLPQQMPIDYQVSCGPP